MAHPSRNPPHVDEQFGKTNNCCRNIDIRWRAAELKSNEIGLLNGRGASLIRATVNHIIQISNSPRARRACPLRAKTSVQRKRHRPHSLSAPGKPYCELHFRHVLAKARGRAGRQGSARTHGPRRLAASRLAEVRITASPPSPMASRARCLIGLLRAAPGGRYRFRRFAFRRERLSTAMDPRWTRLPRLTRLRRHHHGAPWPAAGAGTARLGPPGGKKRAASPTLPPRPPLPAPRLETLIRHPSLWGGIFLW